MTVKLSMPSWVATEVATLAPEIVDVEERVRTVIRFSRLNFEHQTGGPFAAGVFERDSGRLVSMGVNRVIANHCSSAHAEVMAISLAQKQLENYDLGAPGLPAHQLVVNWRPCAMCYGALIWSGVTSLAIPGSGPELESITGFDEGPVHPDWKQELVSRDIEVIEDICRDEAVAVFRDFAASDALVYNARLGDIS